MKYLFNLGQRMDLFERVAAKARWAKADGQHEGRVVAAVAVVLSKSRGRPNVWFVPRRQGMV